MSKPTVALQLYTVRDFTAKDVPGTLKKVKEMGYDAVELAGIYDMEPAAFKALLDEIGLKAVSAHVMADVFKPDVKGTVEMFKSLGCKVIGIPWASTDDLPGGKNYPAMKALMEEIAVHCKANGIKQIYHNHEFEFAKLPCGETIFDALFADIPADVLQVQLDTGWVTVAGLDPVSFIQKYTGRCPAVHLKDVVFVEPGKHEDRPVGQGVQDFPAVTKAAEENGVEIFVVELDEAVGITSMEAAKQSRDYLKTIGY